MSSARQQPKRKIPLKLTFLNKYDKSSLFLVAKNQVDNFITKNKQVEEPSKPPSIPDIVDFQKDQKDNDHKTFASSSLSSSVQNEWLSVFLSILFTKPMISMVI